MVIVGFVLGLVCLVSISFVAGLNPIAPPDLIYIVFVVALPILVAAGNYGVNAITTALLFLFGKNIPSNKSTNAIHVLKLVAVVIIPIGLLGFFLSLIRYLSADKEFGEACIGGGVALLTSILLHYGLLMPGIMKLKNKAKLS